MSGLRFPLVCFDLDGTLVDDTVYIWSTLHERFATDRASRQAAYDAYMQGQISYPEWFAHDLELLDAAGLTRASLARVLDDLKPMNGARELLVALQRRGHRLAIISGSLDVVVDHLFAPGLFDHVLVNGLDFAADGRLAGGRPTPYDLEGKARGLVELCRREGLPTSAAAFIGDNANDVWIARAAGRAIAFNCKSDELRRACHAELLVKDLRLAAPLLV